MNMLDAMSDTLEAAHEEKGKLDSSGSLSWDHLYEMYGKMITEEFSEGKTGRWLGWAQGVLCARGVLTLDQCKEINRKHAG